MEQNKTVSEQPDGAGGATYEAPAIEQSASFERLALMCSRTPPEVESGDCLLPTVNS